MQDDSKLIDKAQKGDNAAFEALVMKYDRQVLNIAFGYRNNQDDADDIYQEVFMRVYKGLKNFESRSKFSTWLYRITVNVCLEFKRKEKVRKHEPLEKYYNDDELLTSFTTNIDSGLRTDKSIIDDEFDEIIQTEVDRLPNQLKMAFTLKYYQGLKIREISNIMNCTEGTIKSYLFTSSRKLRTKLKPILEI